MPRDEDVTAAADRAADLTELRRQNQRLREELRSAQAANAALTAARDAALRVAAWGGARRIESGTRDEH